MVLNHLQKFKILFDPDPQLNLMDVWMYTFQKKKKKKKHIPFSSDTDYFLVMSDIKRPFIPNSYSSLI